MKTPTAREVVLVTAAIAVVMVALVVGGMPTTLQLHVFGYTILGLWAIVVPVKYCRVCWERDSMEADLGVSEFDAKCLRGRMDRAIRFRDAARNRTKYFVDLMCTLAVEPFSRRKREAFFKVVRERGVDAALTGYEKDYGTLIDRDHKKSIRAEAVMDHKEMAEEVRQHIRKENAALFEVIRRGESDMPSSSVPI